MAFFARIFLFLGGVIASWFVSKEISNFIVYQLAATVLLIALVAALLVVIPRYVKKQRNGHDLK